MKDDVVVDSSAAEHGALAHGLDCDTDRPFERDAPVISRNIPLVLSDPCYKITPLKGRKSNSIGFHWNEAKSCYQCESGCADEFSHLIHRILVSTL